MFVVRDSEIVKRIKNNDERVLLILHKQNHAAIRKLVLRNQGQEDDVADVLQEALIATWQNVIQDKFEPDAKLSTYIYAIARNYWFKQLRKRKKETSGDDMYLASEEATYESKLDKATFRACLEELGETCKNILHGFYFDGYTMKELAGLFNFANADTVKARKHQCLKKLTELVQSRFKKKDFL